MVASLILSPPPDMGGGMIIALLGLAIGAAVLLFMGIVVVEAVILRLLDWPSIRTALLDSFQVNLVTTILGIFMESFDVVSMSYETWVMLWVTSVIVEGVLLQAIRWQPVRKTWAASFVMNIVSYIAMYATLSLLDWI